MTAPGRKVPKRGLVGVLSATPQAGAKAGSSWLGMPPIELPRSAEGSDEDPDVRPAAAPDGLARAVVELCRIIPVMGSARAGRAGARPAC